MTKFENSFQGLRKTAYLVTICILNSLFVTNTSQALSQIAIPLIPTEIGYSTNDKTLITAITVVPTSTNAITTTSATSTDNTSSAASNTQNSISTQMPRMTKEAIDRFMDLYKKHAIAMNATYLALQTVFGTPEKPKSPDNPFILAYTIKSFYAALALTEENIDLSSRKFESKTLDKLEYFARMCRLLYVDTPVDPDIPEESTYGICIKTMYYHHFLVEPFTHDQLLTYMANALYTTNKISKEQLQLLQSNKYGFTWSPVDRNTIKDLIKKGNFLAPGTEPQKSIDPQEMAKL